MVCAALCQYSALPILPMNNMRRQLAFNNSVQVRRVARAERSFDEGCRARSFFAASVHAAQQRLVSNDRCFMWRHQCTLLYEHLGHDFRGRTTWLHSLQKLFSLHPRCIPSPTCTMSARPASVVALAIATASRILHSVLVSIFDLRHFCAILVLRKLLLLGGMLLPVAFEIQWNRTFQCRGGPVYISAPESRPGVQNEQQHPGG